MSDEAQRDQRKSISPTTVTSLKSWTEQKTFSWSRLNFKKRGITLFYANKNPCLKFLFEIFYNEQGFCV
jgi:hypothetical protein